MTERFDLPTPTDDDVRICALVKGCERYVFLFAETDQQKRAAISKMVGFAANPDLSFSWADAAKLARQVVRG